MSNLVGFLVAIIAAIYFLFISGDVSMYLDMHTVALLIPLIYGLSLISFGKELTLQSIFGFKYLISPASKRLPLLANVYKTQIKFSIIAAIIGFFAGLVSILTNMNDPAAIGPAYAVLVLVILYSALAIGLVYYPLYKKLS